MKLLITGDWHLRFKKPEMRLDEDYFQTQSDKIKQILYIAKANDCKTILQPGDFFDSVETPWFVVQHYMKMFLQEQIDIWTIPGQHDLRYHTREIENTPLGVLEASVAIRIATEAILDNFCLYGSWWGQEIPDIETINTINIIMAHQMIVQKKLWQDQIDFSYAKDLLKKNPNCDLFVTGDNHQSFIEEYQGRYLINCGSLMRANIDQVDHKPVVYIYDTDKKSFDEIFLKVKPIKKVLNLDRAHIQKQRDEKLELFIDTLKTKGRESNQYNFIERLYEIMNTNDISLDIREIIEEVLAK